MATELTMAQASELRLLENQIRAGGKSISEGFLKIRERKLYAAYGTFDRYCKDIWGISRGEGYKIIVEAKVKERLTQDCLQLETVQPPAMPTTGSQLRELAAAPPDQQALAWQATVATADGKPTAADVKEVVEVIAEAPKAALKKLATAVKSGEPEKVEEVIAEIRGEEPDPVLSDEGKQRLKSATKGMTGWRSVSDALSALGIFDRHKESMQSLHTALKNQEARAKRMVA